MFSLSKAQACASCAFSLFCSSKVQACASWYFLCLCSRRQNYRPVQSWYFLCLCSARQRHTLMQAAGTFSVFVLLVKTIGTCKLVLSLSLFCSSSKPQARVSWYCLCLCSALRQNLRPVQAGNVLCLCSASLRHRLTKAGTFSVFCFPRQRHRPTKAGTFSALVLLVVESPVSCRRQQKFHSSSFNPGRGKARVSGPANATVSETTSQSSRGHVGCCCCPHGGWLRCHAVIYMR